VAESRNILIRRGVAAMLTLLAPAPAAAILVQPIQIRMTSSGPESSAAITVINDRNRPDTVEISVSKLALAQQGAPNITKDNGDQFLIFPPVATIEPGKTQIFRIRWVGEPVLPEAQSYMFTTAELPVNQEKSTGVQLVYAIQSLVTVTSPGLSSAVAVDAAVRTEKTDTTEAKGQAADKSKGPVPGLMVTFENSGNDVAFLSDYSAKLEITAPGAWSRDLTNDDVSNFAGLGLIEPNSKRDIFIPVADLPASGDVKVMLKQEKNKR
jgi:P pilus assembly chaperone PapD